MPSLVVSPPKTIGACATLACLWEATAPKPGNVYRGADFEDLSYADFLTSAAVVGPVLERAANAGVGATVLEAVRRTQAAVATNTNLGMMLLIAPLAAANVPLVTGICEVMTSLDDADATQVFEAIRTARPGGLGSVNQADVNETTTPAISLLEAMQLAADRDLVARQYINSFRQVFEVANLIASATHRGLPLSEAIVASFLQLLSDYPDTLITRKCGPQVASDVSAQAARVLTQGRPGDAAYETALREFDFSLRVDGHRHNPGTSADLIAAGLFVVLREDRLNWPVEFYRCQEPKN